ncbi:ABC transporter permease [Microlunatus sp. GCM10028923]|uniref:ABC transporter permease n=1 Tax=Microlunatus sp. GCM10028923 TaxID=3273400 RepID=UPI003605C472
MNLFSYLLDPANWPGAGKIVDLLLQHLWYTAAAVLLGAVIAIPLGILIGHTGRGSFLVIGTSNAARAVPTLGLLVLVVVLLGTGTEKIVPVLAVLALPAILTATAAGIGGADREAVHAARAIGMTEGQIVAQVEWPLALPLVVSGLRSATLQVVATATVAAFAAGGGLGQLLISGQRNNDYPQMFAGAVLIAGMAIVLDLLLGGVGWLIGRNSRARRAADRVVRNEETVSPSNRSEAVT